MYKTALIKSRVTPDVKDAVARLAAERGESESVIVREALNALILRESQEKAAANNPIPAAVPVTYRKTRRKP